MLLDNPFGRTTETFALAALMHLHAARLPAKLNASGELTTLLDQDRSVWDREHVQAGMELLASASTGQALTEYHIEALIAGVHVTARDVETTDWTTIVELYDSLLVLNASPVVALNRSIAISQAEGPERGLEEMRRIPEASRLEGYPFYWAAIGELQALMLRTAEAKASFERAHATARSPAERKHLQKRIETIAG